MVEKHFILNHKLGGSDSAFPIEPQDFKAMIETVCQVDKSRVNFTSNVSDNDKKRRDLLFLTKDIKEGERFTKENIRSIGPVIGLHPNYLKEIIGQITE